MYMKCIDEPENLLSLLQAQQEIVRLKKLINEKREGNNNITLV